MRERKSLPAVVKWSRLSFKKVLPFFPKRRVSQQMFAPAITCLCVLSTAQAKSSAVSACSLPCSQSCEHLSVYIISKQLKLLFSNICLSATLRTMPFVLIDKQHVMWLWCPICFCFFKYNISWVPKNLSKKKLCNPVSNLGFKGSVNFCWSSGVLLILTKVCNQVKTINEMIFSRKPDITLKKLAGFSLPCSLFPPFPFCCVTKVKPNYVQ